METVTVSKFVEKFGIDWTISNLGRVQSPWNENPKNQVEHYHVELRRGDKKMTLSYYCGLACNRPTGEEVLDILRADFESVIMSDWNKLSFEEWASELGYDSDSRKDEKTYKAVLHQSNRLMKFLTDENAVIPIYPISELLHTERL